MASDGDPATAKSVPVPELDGQISINDLLLELGHAPVVHPDPDAGTGDSNFF
jgi:hypothetical protein